MIRRCSALAAAFCAATGCAELEFGTTSASMKRVVQPYCPEPNSVGPNAIDSEVRGLLVSGEGLEQIWISLFDIPHYGFVEWELRTPRPDGTRFLRYVRTDWTKTGCPAGARQIGSVPDGPSVSSYNCAKVTAIAAPSARWHLRRTVSDRIEGNFSFRASEDQIIDRRDGTVVWQGRKVVARSAKATRIVWLLGPVPLDRGKRHVAGVCGQQLAPGDLKRALPPPRPASQGYHGPAKR